MKIRLWIGIGILTSGPLMYFLGTTYFGASRGEAQSLRVDIPVRIESLKEIDGSVPVDFKCEKAEFTPPNKLDSLSCVAINNTNKEIVSIVVVYTISSIAGNERSNSSGSITNDLLMHRDLFAIRRKYFVSPAGSLPVHLLPTTLSDGSLIDDVSMYIGHIEFSDGSAISKDSRFVEQISQFRKGFAIHRDWYRTGYRELKKLNFPVTDEWMKRLESSAKDELRYLNSNQAQGAKNFQKFMSQTFSKEGGIGIDAILK